MNTMSMSARDAAEGAKWGWMRVQCALTPSS